MKFCFIHTLDSNVSYWLSYFIFWKYFDFFMNKRKIYFPVKVTLAVLGATAHAEEKKFRIDSEKVLLQIKIKFVSSSHYNLNLCLNSDFFLHFISPKHRFYFCGCKFIFWGGPPSKHHFVRQRLKGCNKRSLIIIVWCKILWENMKRIFYNHRHCWKVAKKNDIFYPEFFDQ